MTPGIEKVIILSAPSGAGKTTIIKTLVQEIPQLVFSVSATTREPREGEIDGKDYYFLSNEEFNKKKENNEFVEYEEVYAGLQYGTLKQEVTRIWGNGQIAVFDVDVKGGVNIKKTYGDKALLLFIEPPSLGELEKRLRERGTESEEVLQMRLKKADEEIDFIKAHFDKKIINDHLPDAIAETLETVKAFINEPNKQ